MVTIKIENVEAETEIDVKCECGQYLDADMTRCGYLEVAPCKSCIASAVEDAKESA